MKNIIFVLSVLLFFSCTDEPDQNNYTVSFRNQSGSTLDLIFVNDNDDEVFNETLLDGQSSSSCSYIYESFVGFSCKDIGEIRVIFFNDKGYICIGGNIGNLCFLNNRNPFTNSESFNNLGNNSYEFVITEEDFNNAHDLPE